MGSFATILAFDIGQNAFSVGRQMSDETETTRGELVHASASLAVGIVIVGVAAVVYIAAFEGLSVSSLAFLLFGAMLLVWVIRQ
jgi:Flp pilus assembly protein TadB